MRAEGRRGYRHGSETKEECCHLASSTLPPCREQYVNKLCTECERKSWCSHVPRKRKRIRFDRREEKAAARSQLLQSHKKIIVGHVTVRK